MLGPWALTSPVLLKYSRSPNQQVDKGHPHDGRPSLETIHSTKRLRSRLMRLAGRPSMNLGDGSRATAPASEHGPSSIDITSQGVLRRVSHPRSQAPSHQRYISASPSPEKTGRVQPSSSVNTSKWSFPFFVISHQGEPGGLPVRSHALLYNTSDPSLPIRRPAPGCMETSCPISAPAGIPSRAGGADLPFRLRWLPSRSLRNLDGATDAPPGHASFGPFLACSAVFGHSLVSPGMDLGYR
jgi:hypothetical protein